MTLNVNDNRCVDRSVVDLPMANRELSFDIDRSVNLIVE